MLLLIVDYSTNNSSLFSPSQNRKEKEHKKKNNWHLQVCKKIVAECDFHCNEIIEIYFRREGGNFFIIHFNLIILSNSNDISYLNYSSCEGTAWVEMRNLVLPELWNIGEIMHFPFLFNYNVERFL